MAQSGKYNYFSGTPVVEDPQNNFSAFAKVPQHLWKSNKEQ